MGQATAPKSILYIVSLRFALLGIEKTDSVKSKVHNGLRVEAKVRRKGVYVFHICFESGAELLKIISTA